MKGILLYFVLLASVVFGDENIEKKLEGDETEEFLYNPDDYEIIVSPCQVYDLNCIRRFFADHSKCTIRNGPVPGRFVRSQFSNYFARINLTVTILEADFSGFNNSRVEEFYINKATNNVVIAIEARDLSGIADLTYFNFFRKGREPISAMSSTFIQYKSVTVTAVIPNINDMQFDKAEITAYANQPSPIFTIGPEVANNPDPTVVQTVAELIQDPRTNFQEQLLTEFPYAAILYIQTNICDFGLKFS